ncbi:MFS transporter [Moritella viscosa]|uniref:Membrane protein n=1 Tax=Moritella viscosa TaxID=80854 RepID=A0ABY1HKC1_9GAMM|nr:MFS transporter [Moritella viscosa]SGZ03993.1 Putative membrane protein [Moritella viscosa]SGZ18329.1 Putative membrane protein [Moritella viscosa]SHO28403.1 Putative membrane protein [Moritella viscosa]
MKLLPKSPSTSFSKESPFVFLALAGIVMSMTFSAWNALLNNFAIENAAFTGAEIGTLQSIRELPGLLAFTAAFVLLILKEQVFAIIALSLLSIGVAITGFSPSVYGLYATTVLMSVGFHYYETINQSLSLQWFSKTEAPAQLGKLLAVKSFAALFTFAGIWLAFTVFDADYVTVYMACGLLGLVITAWLATHKPKIQNAHVQYKKLILRKRYSLYYLLTFLSGARRQIFVVFAGFLMVEKFGYGVPEITALFMLNHVINLYLGPKIGAWIGRVGERRALTFEYTGLIFVFIGYALVESAEFAAVLYIIDHLFFAVAIALKTYFQKIADPKDIAGSMGVSFSINHIAAVVIPVIFGMIWLYNPSLVFYAGAAIASLSLILSRFIPVTYESKSSVSNNAV